MFPTSSKNEEATGVTTRVSSSDRAAADDDFSPGARDAAGLPSAIRDHRRDERDGGHEDRPGLAAFASRIAGHGIPRPEEGVRVVHLQDPVLLDDPERRNSPRML
jgi:hypothetical protein